MSDAKSAGIFVTTAPVEMVFPHLFEPRAFKRGEGRQVGEPKYDGMFVFDADHPDLTPLKQHMARLAKAEWGGNEGVRFPLKSGSKIADEAKAKTPPKDNEFLRDRLTVTARSIYAPGLSVLMDGRGFVDFRDDARASVKDKFYAGVQVLVELNFVPQLVDGNKYMTAYLNKVASLNKGERRGGGKPASETFAGYAGKVSAEDPTADLEEIAY